MRTLQASTTRRASALVAVFALSVVLAGVAMSVSSFAVSRAKQQKQRENELLLFTTIDSGMSLLFSYFYDDWSQLPTSTTWTDMTPTRGGAPVMSMNGITLYYQAKCITPNKMWRLRVEGRAGSTATPDSYRRQMMEASIAATSAFYAGASGMYSPPPYTLQGAGHASWFDSNPAVMGPNKTVAKNQPGGPWVLASANGVTVQKAGNVSGKYGTLTLTPPSLRWTPTPATATSALTANVSLSPGSYHYTAWTSGIVTIPSNGTVTLWIDGNIDYGAIGVKYLTAGSTLKVWQTNPTFAHSNTNSSQLNGNAYLGDTAHPDRLMIFSNTDGTITLNGNASMGAVLIAPNATLMMRGTFDYYGSLFVGAMTADKVTGNPSFNYDVNLADLVIPELQYIAWNAWCTTKLAYPSGMAADPASHRFGDLTQPLDP